MNFDAPDSDPIAACEGWFEEARSRCTVPNSHAMAVATVDGDGHPSCRMVLRKGFDARGVVFYTNRHSRKGQDLDATHHAAALFFWDELDRQIRIEGPIEVVSDAESNLYFSSRPRGSQIGAWASDQSNPCESHARIQDSIKLIEDRFEGRDVPRPPHWIGYRIKPQTIEFWQGGADRVHDRVRYTRVADGGWTTQRLWP